MVHITNTLALALATASLTTASPLEIRADGCGKSASKEGYISAQADGQTISVNGVNRQFGLFIPAGYNSDTQRQRKVIFDFHGHGSTPQNQYENSRYDAYDAGKEYIIAYPLGLKGTDGKSAWQAASYATGDDLAFTSQLLTYLKGRYCVGPNHVYASGKSNGGGFVDWLACHDEGDQFAAFAMAAPALYKDTSRGACSKKRAILEAHGSADGTISYTGGTGAGGATPNIPDWVDWWGSRDGCSSSNKAGPTQQSGYSVTSYSCNGFTEVVKHFKVDGLGHCWPTSSTNYDSDKENCDKKQLDFTPQVLDFFSKWTVAKAPQN